MWGVIKLSVVLFLQGSMGPPGPEGLIGPRGESVSESVCQSVAGLPVADGGQTQRGVKQTDRYGHRVALKSFLLLSFPINFLIPYHFLAF